VKENKDSHCIECFNRNELFTSLTKEEQEFLDENKLELKYRKGEVICKQGSFASHIAYLKEGLIKLCLEYNEKNLILRIETVGILIGLPSLCGPAIYRYTCVAYEDCTVDLIELHHFRKLLDQNSVFASQVINVLTESTIATYDRMICLTQKKSHGRLADILLCLSDRIFKNDEFTIPFRRKDFAELSNMSVENLTRTIQDFKRDKIVKITGNNISILKRDMLKKISANG
jgi:CRP-like cAMP-binding protein